VPAGQGSVFPGPSFVEDKPFQSKLGRFGKAKEIGFFPPPDMPVQQGNDLPGKEVEISVLKE